MKQQNTKGKGLFSILFITGIMKLIAKIRTKKFFIVILIAQILLLVFKIFNIFYIGSVSLWVVLLPMIIYVSLFIGILSWIGWKLVGTKVFNS